MGRFTKCWALAALVLVTSLTAMPVYAGGGGFGGGGGGRGFGGGGFGGGGFGGGGGYQINIRQMLLARVQQTVIITDEEWTVIEPKLWRVVQLQLENGTGTAGQLLQRFRGQNIDLASLLGRDADPTIMREGDELRQCETNLLLVLQDTNSSEVSISEKLSLYRMARKKIDAELVVAQEDLRNVLTLRQERS